MLRRQGALDKTLSRYRGRAFAWGVTDCAKFARFHLRAMGHRPPTVPRYRSALGAKRALAKTGHGTLAGLLDSFLPRITPAYRLIGDIVLVEGGDGLDALMIVVSGRKLLGFHEDAEGLQVLNPEVPLIGVWRA